MAAIPDYSLKKAYEIASEVSPKFAFIKLSIPLAVYIWLAWRAHGMRNIKIEIEIVEKHIFDSSDFDYGKDLSRFKLEVS